MKFIPIHSGDITPINEFEVEPGDTSFYSYLSNPITGQTKYNKKIEVCATGLVCTISMLFDGSVSIRKETNLVVVWLNGTRIPLGGSTDLKDGDVICFNSIDFLFYVYDEGDEPDDEFEVRSKIPSVDSVLYDIVVNGGLNSIVQIGSANNSNISRSKAHLYVTVSELIDWLRSFGFSCPQSFDMITSFRAYPSTGSKYFSIEFQINEDALKVRKCLVCMKLLGEVIIRQIEQVEELYLSSESYESSSSSASVSSQHIISVAATRLMRVIEGNLTNKYDILLLAFSGIPFEASKAMTIDRRQSIKDDIREMLVGHTISTLPQYENALSATALFSLMNYLGGENVTNYGNYCNIVGGLEALVVSFQPSTQPSTLKLSDVMKQMMMEEDFAHSFTSKNQTGAMSIMKFEEPIGNNMDMRKDQNFNCLSSSEDEAELWPDTYTPPSSPGQFAKKEGGRSATIKQRSF